MRLRFLLFCFLGAVSAPAHAEADGSTTGKLWHWLTDEAYGSVRIGLVEWTMDIRRPSDGATGRMVQRDERALSIGYGTKPTFFGETNFGYTVLAGWVRFDMKKQEIPGDNFASVGTSITGNMFYALPAVYYQLGDRARSRKFIRLGAGIGAGAADYTGTVRLSTGQTVTTGQSYEAKLATSQFLEGRWEHLSVTLDYASPRIHGGDYDIRVKGLSAKIGFVYYF